MNTTKYWQIVRDDLKRTYEICGQDTNVNHFTNSIHGMQRAGMNVSFLTPPVTSKSLAKGPVTFAGYLPEQGLYKRLVKEYVETSKREFDQY